MVDTELLTFGPSPPERHPAMVDPGRVPYARLAAPRRHGADPASAGGGCFQVFYVTMPSTCATLTISSAVVVPLRTLSLPSARRLFMPLARAALRILLVGARSNASSRSDWFIDIISKMPIRPRNPVLVQKSQPRGLKIVRSLLS